MNLTRQLLPWPKVVIMATFFLGCVAATVYGMLLMLHGLVTPTMWWWLITLYVTGMSGISNGNHRLVTHQSYEARWPVRLAYLVGGCICLQGTPLQWSLDHLWHHFKTDKVEDVHTPQGAGPFLHRLWMAHIGWLFMTRPYGPKHVAEHGPRLMQDWTVRVTSNPAVYWTVGFLPFVLSFIWGAWQIDGTIDWLAGFRLMVWANMIRLFCSLNVTWSVNSICHVWGSFPWRDPHSHARNVLWVAIFGSGEGWHGNHHADPRASNLGVRWWQLMFDFGFWQLWLLKQLRLVTAYRLQRGILREEKQAPV